MLSDTAMQDTFEAMVKLFLGREKIRKYGGGEKIQRSRRSSSSTANHTAPEGLAAIKLPPPA